MSGVADLDQAETLKGAVYRAIGAASVCWKTLEGAGVFQSDRAKLIGEELLAEISSRRGQKFPPCEHGNKFGECVLENGHEHRESEHRTPGGESVPVQWAHIDRHGTHWGVKAAGS
jgi:hypothetical protein